MSQDNLNANESASVELLTGMMGADLDPEIARRILRKCDGDVQKAATAILEGDRGEPVSTWPSTYGKPPTHPDRNQKVPPAPSSSVIDLTNEEDDLSRAMEASLDTTKFGPSDRAPSSDWAMVPSTVSTNAASHDESFTRAMEESLTSTYNDFAATEAYEDLPIEKSVREGGRPVALRPTHASLTYAALVIQSMFAVPQIRHSVAEWRQTDPVEGTTENDSIHLMWPVVELFANMDLAQLSSIVPDDMLETHRVRPWNHTSESPGELAADLYRSVASLITRAIDQQLEDEGLQRPGPQLFSFTYARIANPSPTGYGISDDCLVDVDVGENNPYENDLMSRLTAIMSHYHDNGSEHEIIVKPSEVIAFHLKNGQSATSSTAGSSSTRKIFKYPKILYLDRFLSDNFQLADAKRKQQAEINEQIQKLTAQKNSITHCNGNNTLKSLRSTLYYYEIVAEAKDDAERQSHIDDMAAKVRKILVAVEQHLADTEQEISKLTTLSETLFDCPELQQYPYELRAVVGHDGLFGRRQLHSFVKDKGIWWKCVDTDVTEVSEETVLTDSTGVHLGAGPYLLIYSSAQPEDATRENAPLPWLKPLKNRVKQYNKNFLSALDPAIIAKAQPLYSPPTSPALSSSGSAIDPEGLSRSSSVEEIHMMEAGMRPI